MKTGYCADYKMKRTQEDHRAHFKTLSDVRNHLKESVKDGSIYKESIRVYHGWEVNKVDVTGWALATLKF